MEEYIAAAEKKAIELIQKKALTKSDLEVLKVLSRIICDANAFIAAQLKLELYRSQSLQAASRGRASQRTSKESSAETHAE